LSLRYRAGTDGREPPRIAFAIARNVGSAPVRNRLRRRLRSAIRSLDLRPGASYLVGATPAAVSTGYDKLVTTLGDLVAAAHGDTR
jgi:ribonuclease P protein component